MPTTNPLLVLIVGDAALRSTLTAQLSLAGYELITASKVQDPGLQQAVRWRAALVMDGAAIASRSQEWIETLLVDWWRVVVLVPEGADAPGPDARWQLVDSAALPATLAALAEAWRADQSQDPDRP